MNPVNTTLNLHVPGNLSVHRSAACNKASYNSDTIASQELYMRYMHVQDPPMHYADIIIIITEHYYLRILFPKKKNSS